MSLLEELKRRRVFRVTLAYVVAAGAVLQGADALFPALHLPPWTVTLVAVLVVLGFPVALLLGWAFDVTPHGLTRTPGSFKFPVRAVALATIVLALGVSAFVAWRRRAVAAHLDANAVAILPFRVNGDASLAAMREGMIDLLAVKLSGEGGGPHAIDARTTMSAWRRRISDEKDDLPTADAIQLARRLGAGQVLLGAVVGTPGHVAVSVALHSSVDGHEIASAEETTAPDSILPLVDRVVAKLLSQQAGEGRRAQALLSESLPAVRLYLDGQRLLRRGDYATATQRFNAALEQDSTFALAALGLAGAAGWTEDLSVWRRAQDITLKYRARLPLPDREFVDVAFGYPQRKSALERIRLTRDMVSRAPDRIELWHYLGELYYHYGSLVGVENSYDQALDAWNHALALDSTYMPVVEHQPAMFALRGDTVSLRRLEKLFYSPARPDQRYSSNAWLIASALQDAAWLKELRTRLPSQSAEVADIAMIAIGEAAASQSELPLLLAKSAQQPDAGSGPAALWRAILLQYIGRPTAAMKELDERAADASQYTKLAIAFIDGETDTTGLLSIARRAAHTAGGGSFTGGEYCLLRGDVTCAQTAAAAIRAAQAKVPPDREQNDVPQLIRISGAMLDANILVSSRAAGARALLAHADSLLTNTGVSEEMASGPVSMMALASTRAHVALGDYAGAYEMAKRGANQSLAFATRPALLLEWARTATRLGKRDEAITAYRRYLNIRQQPEPGPASAAAEQARHELELLTGERAARL